jgi:hypothetical protein
MTGWRKRTIMEMAREAEIKHRTDVFYSEFCDGVYDVDLEAFAALARADERERIAKWYACEGHMMFPVAIPDAIRSNT